MYKTLNIKEVKRSEYYYGINPCHFANLTYIGALKEKIRLGKELKKELLKDKDWVENKRIDDIQEAIEFNQALLNEIKYCQGE